jgi:glutamate 5-kinase
MTAKFRTIVVKIGSSTLTDKKGRLDIANLNRIVNELSQIKNSGKKVVIVSSGAIVTGSGMLKFKTKPSSIPEKQAAAAVGQSALMQEYSKAFKKYGVIVAQVLLTKGEMLNENRNANTKNALKKLMSLGVIPVINENDTVSVDEIKIGDNDNLSAYVAKLVDADLLIMLTDVEGFIIDKKVVPYISKIDKKIERAAGLAGGDIGTGGMVTKLQAVRTCLSSNIVAAIVNGRRSNVLVKLSKGSAAGTIFRKRG